MVDKAKPRSQRDIKQKFEEISERAREKKKKEEEELQKKKEEEQKLLPFNESFFWAETHRAAPSYLLRSPLFAVVKRGPRKDIRDELLASWGEGELYYMGHQLDQSDLDVYMECIQVLQEEVPGKFLELEKYSFLKRLGRSTGKNDWEWLKRSIKRMSACAVTIKRGRGEYFGPLVYEGGINDDSGKMRISLNPYLLNLFNTGYTLQFMEKRKLLKQDMAKWLCGYVESHKATIEAPHYVKLKQIKELCGSEAKDLHRFRYIMRKAIETLTTQKIIKDGDLDEHDTFWFYKPS